MTFLESMAAMLSSPLMQRGLMVSLLVGIAAPVMGTYLVQRRLALLGDGMGHVALTGVAMGWLAGSAAGLTPHDLLAVPGAVIAAVVGAVLIEPAETLPWPCSFTAVSPAACCSSASRAEPPRT